MQTNVRMSLAAEIEAIAADALATKDARVFGRLIHLLRD